jgi:hypothetical protein
MTDPLQIVPRLNFGRVDGETDNRFEQCFIGTEMLRQVLLPQHSLVVGNKGSGKSAMCRLLSHDLSKVRPLLPKQYEKIYTVPAYGLQSEESMPTYAFKEFHPGSVDEFRYYWLLYIGLKAASTVMNDPAMQGIISKSTNPQVKNAAATLRRILGDVGLYRETGLQAILTQAKSFFSRRNNVPAVSGNGGVEFHQRTGTSILAMLEAVDTILRETKSLAWILLDKLDLLFVDDIQKLRDSITGLVQLLVQYGNQWKNIHLKIFLRNDIYRQLHIVNKSHLVSYSTEMRWRGPLLLKMIVARGIVDPQVQAYCEERLGEKLDITNVILGNDDFVLRVFYTIFEQMTETSTSTHQWMMNRLVDGMGNSFPREVIHLGNRAVERQREMNRQNGTHEANGLISMKALRDAFEAISAYRCDTYLYSEFPHLAQHFDALRGSETSTFQREDLYALFARMSPSGDEAIRAVYDTGLLAPVGSTVDSSRKFKIPLLYKSGLGIIDRRKKSVATEIDDEKHAQSLVLLN